MQKFTLFSGLKDLKETLLSLQQARLVTLKITNMYFGFLRFYDELVSDFISFIYKINLANSLIIREIQVKVGNNSNDTSSRTRVDSNGLS